ncbi:MAG TPA: squalene/phytoene synthase family protein [Gammaproteobacteria bacterium]|nr:squalene/phytoene synthase family protein [Gammaproteobacteria bacterium]
MNPSAQAEQKLAAAPLDLRLALTFSPMADRAALTALFALYLEIREVPVECRDPGVAEVKLAWWQQEIEALYAWNPRHPLTQALAPHLAPIAGCKPVFLDLITGTRMDITGSALASYEDVKRYCYRHSGALAELGALLAGARSREALLAARLLGNSHRLAYITTAGTAEALHGRVYFAAQDLQAHGVDRHVHGESGSDTAIAALLEDYAGRVRDMRREALAGTPAAEHGALAAWRVLSALGLKRLARLETRGFRSGAEPVELQPLNALFTAWRGARTTG